MPDDETYQHLQQLRHQRGWELMEQYGAHGLGVGKKTVGSKKTDDWSLIFYVERKGDGPEPIPPRLRFLPEGKHQEVELATDVVEAPRARLEAGESS